VCHQWQEASSSNDDSESLQLLMDLSSMSKADQSRALSWMAKHGQQVEELDMAGCIVLEQPQNWFSSAAPALTGLRRLEVDLKHSLSLLAPVLGRLPQLQHLEVQVAMTSDVEDDAAGDAHEEQAAGVPILSSVFVDHHNKPWEEVPDLQQVCPHLKQLRLQLHFDSWCASVDPRLPRLLPVHLHKLTLSVANKHYQPVLYLSSLSHLTALQHLRLDSLEVQERGMDAVVQQLRALPRLCVSYTPDMYHDSSFALQAADLINEYAPSSDMLVPVDVLAQLTGLTHLTLKPRGGSLPEGTADAISMMTRLQDLCVEGTVGDDMAAVVQQAAGMSKLRTLRLDGRVDDPAQLSCRLAGCTQLACLVMSARGPDGSECAAVPPQLTGLTCLGLTAYGLVRGGGTWLAPLTQLARLHVFLPDKPDEKLTFVTTHGQVGASPESEQLGMAEGLVQHVPEWPASLQCVKFWVTRGGSARLPRRWHYLPATQGAARITVWLDAAGSKSFCSNADVSPCPHLPGVWEVL
jgi:hypothetical protein